MTPATPRMNTCKLAHFGWVSVVYKMQLNDFLEPGYILYSHFKQMLTLTIVSSNKTK